jgi:hypothetical protein
MALPHIDGCSSSSANLASWEFSGGQSSWETILLQDIEWSADLWSSWDAWCEWDFLTVSDPSLSLESVPESFMPFEDIASMMPVTFVEGPSSSGESSLGWSPVVPLATIVSVPDFLAGNPLPSVDHSVLSAPVADSMMISMCFDEFHALSLSGENVVVFSINLMFTFTVMSFVGVLNIFVISGSIKVDVVSFLGLVELEKRFLINVHVLALLFHLSGFLNKFVIDWLGINCRSSTEESGN